MKPSFLFPSAEPIRFLTKHRAGFLDLDFYGHLNSLAYLKIIVEHRFSQIHDVIGWTLAKIQTFPTGFLTQKLEIDYQRSILGDEEFTIESWVNDVSETSCVVKVEVRKANGKMAAAANLYLVNVDRKTNRPTPWTSEILCPFFQQDVRKVAP